MKNRDNVIYLNERRKYHREISLTSVDYDVKGQSFKGFVKNISDYGVFIKTTKIFSVGQKINIKLPLPNNKKYLTGRGEIIRITPEGIGVKMESVLDHPIRKNIRI